MTKEEVIKEAYGKYYEIAKQFADENGWIDRFKQSYYLNIGNWGLVDPPIIKNILDFNDSGGIQVYNDKWRPSILRGIENNNGWTKIESEKDLPQDINYAYVVARDKEILYKSGVSKSTVDYLYATGKITHYQQIQEFKSPVF